MNIDSITLNVANVISRKVEDVAIAREGFILDKPNLVVDEAESLTISVNTLTGKFLNITIFYLYSFGGQF